MQTYKPSKHLTFDTVQSNSKRLHKRLRDCHEASLCLDLSEVVQCDSAGLAFLIEARRLCIRYKKKLELSNVPQAIHSLAEFCGVQSMLND